MFLSILEEKARRVLYYLRTFLHWVLLSVITGLTAGGIAGLFAHLITVVTNYRMSHPLIILGLPLGGLFIVFLYNKAGLAKDAGTDTVITAVRSDENIPLAMAPAILAATVVTHLFGGSSGREGAALQFGGSIATAIGRLLHLPEDDRKIMIMAGMSAAFSALFGTPLAAAIFSMEVISVGVMYYSALVPCVFSALIAHYAALKLHVASLQSPLLIQNLPDFFSLVSIRVVLLALACAAVGVIFCIALKYTSYFYRKYFPNPYKRIFAAGCIIILLAALLHTQDYLGLGSSVIQASLYTPSRPYAFILKIVFTCLTLCAGYKGGEIVPSLFIGAVMGSFLSVILGLPVNISAACGMIGVFCAVTNSPVTSMLIAFELFGFEGMPYFCTVTAVSYMLSGYYGLYHAQKIVYSKTKPKYVDRRPH